MKAALRFALLSALAVSGACTVHGVDVPPLTGPSEFYDRMDTYNEGYRWGETWTTNAQRCANALRAYANEFYPE